jgi:hypothetical protein
VKNKDHLLNELLKKVPILTARIDTMNEPKEKDFESRKKEQPLSIWNQIQRIYAMSHNVYYVY